MKQNKKTESSFSSTAVLKKLLAIIGRFRLLLIFSVLLAAVSVILQLYVPILFGKAIDCIVSEGEVDFSAIGSILFRAGIMIAISASASWIMNMINNRLAYKTIHDLRAKAIRHIQILPLSYLDTHSSGDTVQRIIADTDQLADGLLLGFTQLFSSAVMIAATLIFMFSFNVGISLMVVVLTPVSFLVAKFITSRTYAMFQKQTEVRGRQTAFINEMIGSEKLIKAFGYEKRASSRFEVLNEELRGYSEKAVFFSSLTNPSTRAVNNVIYALVALVGAFRILAGALSVGGLTVLLSYANQYMKPFNDISSVITELQNALACAARVFDLLEAEPQTTESENDLPPAVGKIDAEDVSFSYVKTKPLIEHLSLHADAGMKIAIVGPTGCGKTTFINLLMRFYDIDAGAILIDGSNINDCTRRSLRENFGMVLQETWLKNGTVRDNLLLAKPEVSDDEIIAACKDSHSWEFIRRMPNGLDTPVTDDSLSQGQKQLLCITRVMLRKPPMLILDEATSSIDTRTEVLIQQAFDKLMKNRTSFIVAHRLSTIRNADIILVMKDGHIIEQGNHETLLRSGGFYAELYNSQFKQTEA